MATIGKNTEGLDSGNAEKQMGLGSKSQKKKRKNFSFAPKSAMAAKESNFDDNKRVRSKKKVLLPLIDSPRKDEPESETEPDEEEEGIPSSDEEKRKNKTKKKKPLVEINDGSESESNEDEEGIPSSDEEKRKNKTKKKKSLVEKNDGSESESNEDEEGIPSSDEEKQKNKTKKKKSLVEKNDRSDSESDEEEENAEPKQIEGKEKYSKSGEEKGTETSSSEDEDNQKKASDKAPDESDDSAAEKVEETSKYDETDRKRKKPLENKTPAKCAAIKPFQRVWSENDETVLLNGVIEYCKAKDVEISMVDKEGLLEFIGGSCRFHFEPNRRQLREKIRKLKKKYEKNSKRADHSNMIPHEMKVFNLSRKLWGHLNDGLATEATKDEEAEVVTKVQNAPQQSAVEKQLRFQECELYRKRLELMTEKTLLNLEQRFLSSVKKDD